MKMIMEEIKQIKSGVKEWRSFGIQMAVILGLVVGFIGWQFHKFSFVLTGLALFFLVSGVLAPIVLKPVHKFWMSLAVILGMIISPVILTVLYFITITPIGIICRLSGKKLLDLSFRSGEASYWIQREQKPFDKKKYELQY